MPPRQETTTQWPSLTSYVKLFILFLVYALFFYTTQSPDKLIWQIVPTLFPPILLAYAIWNHKKSKVSSDELISQYIHGAVPWFVWHTIILLTLYTICSIILVIGITIYVYSSSGNTSMFSDLLLNFARDQKSFNDLEKKMENGVGVEREYIKSRYPIHYFTSEAQRNMVFVLPILGAVANTLSAYYLVNGALHTIITTHNIEEPIGIDLVFNYSAMGVLGLATTVVAACFWRNSITMSIGSVIYVVVFIGAVMIIATEYTKFLRFRERKKVGRALASAFLYLLSDEVLYWIQLYFELDRFDVLKAIGILLVRFFVSVYANFMIQGGYIEACNKID